jgi:thiol-disulfide isomerase/thioredoxin
VVTRPMRVTRIFLITAGTAVLTALGAAAYYLSAEFLTYTPDKPPFREATVQIHSASSLSDTLGFSFFDQPRALPAFEFSDSGGRIRTLAGFRGRPILLNIWATWCVPCREEMPSLDRLQSLVGKSQLLVLPLSIDQQGAAIVSHFYQELGLKDLDIYLDPAANSSRMLNTIGIPTTLLIDRNGEEIGRKIGAEEWDSPEIVAQIRRRLGLPPAGQSGEAGQ